MVFEKSSRETAFEQLNRYHTPIRNQHNLCLNLFRPTCENLPICLPNQPAHRIRFEFQGLSQSCLHS